MKAALLLRERIPFSEDSFAEFVLWPLPQPLPGSEHRYKYRLAFVRDNECLVRFDNESGKVDPADQGGGGGGGERRDLTPVPRQQRAGILASHRAALAQGIELT